MTRALQFRRFLFLVVLLFGSPTISCWAAAAKSAFDEKAVADFYKGKTVRIIVGFSAGGATMLTPA